MVAQLVLNGQQQVLEEPSPLPEKLPIVYVRVVLGPAQGMTADDLLIRQYAVEPGTEVAFGQAIAAAFKLGNRRQVVKLQRRQMGVQYPLDAYDTAVHNRRLRFQGQRQQQGQAEDIGW